MKDKVDIIIFSKDRAMQLDALLCSISKYVENIGKVYVLYKASNIEFQKGYLKIFEKAIFLSMTTPQSYLPCQLFVETDFKKRLNEILSLVKTKRVLLLCDDVVFTDKVDLNVYVPWLSWNSINLCLGFNIDWCNAKSCVQTIQHEFNMYKDLIRWKWTEEKHDFAYPNSIGASIFKTWWIKILAKILPYDCPNWLEGRMNNKWVKLFIPKRTISYYKSKAYCLLLNQVQTVYKFQEGTPRTSTKKLNDLFLQDKFIDISELEGIEYDSIMLPDTYLKISCRGGENESDFKTC